MKVYIAGNEYEKCLNDCKIAFMNVSIEMSQKLENENINAANISSKIIVEIQKIFDQVDKFFTEDLYRDIPTGDNKLLIIILLFLCKFQYII